MISKARIARLEATLAKFPASCRRAAAPLMADLKKGLEQIEREESKAPAEVGVEVSRQQQRAAERAKAKAGRRAIFDRIHGQVLEGKTIRDLWLTYAKARLEPHGIDINEEAVRETLERSFYAGVAAMLELSMRVSTDDISEDVGVEMLNRLHEELDAYSKRGRSNA